jgi:hypothetical protein
MAILQQGNSRQNRIRSRLAPFQNIPDPCALEFGEREIGQSIYDRTNREEPHIWNFHACVLLASGSCTDWNKLELLAGKRVSY